MDSWSKHWHVAVYLAGLIFVAGIVYAGHSTQDERIAEHERKLQKVDIRERQDAVDIARVKANQENFKEDIEEIKEEIKENSDKLDEILKELRNQ